MNTWQRLNAFTSVNEHIPVPFQSTVTMEGDKLVHVQKWDGKETKFVREIKDGKMVMVRRTETDHTHLLLHLQWTRFDNYQYFIVAINESCTKLEDAGSKNHHLGCASSFAPACRPIKKSQNSFQTSWSTFYVFRLT